MLQVIKEFLAVLFIIGVLCLTNAHQIQAQESITSTVEISNEPTPTANGSITIDYLNVFFGVVGVVGTVLAVVSWYSANKESKLRAYLYDIADKNIKKDLSEAELKRLQDNITTSTQKIESLQIQIRKDIPLEARRAVLRDRLNIEVEQLTQHHESIQKIKKELDELGVPVAIPQELMLAIESEISPEYLVKQRQSRLQVYLTIITTAAAITSSLFSSILPDITGRFITITILLLAVPVLYLMIKDSFPSNPKERRRFYTQILSRFFLVIGTISLLISGFIIYLAVLDPEYGIMVIIWISVTAISLGSGFILNRLTFRQKQQL